MILYHRVGTDSLAINEEFEQPSYGNYKGINGNGYMNANGKVDTESCKFKSSFLSMCKHKSAFKALIQNGTLSNG